MADTLPAPAPKVPPQDGAANGAADRAPVEQRGRTVVAEKVVQRIASAATAEIEAVVDTREGWTKLVRKGLPHAEARLAGETAEITAEVAVTWPTPLAGVAAQVRDRVAQRVVELTGVEVARVEVTVADVAPAAPTPRLAGLAGPAAPVDPADALEAGKPPVGTGSSPLFAQLIALGLVVLAVVGVQNLLVELNAVSDRSWITSLVDTANGVRGDSVLVLVVGVVAVVLGVLLLPVVFKRRPRRGVELTARTGVHLRPRDVRRVAEAAIDDADAITRSSVKATRRRVKVRATTFATDRDGAIEADLRERVSAALTALEKQPRTTVKLSHEES